MTLAFSGLFFSCNNPKELRSQLKNILGQQLTFPKEIISVKGDKVSFVNHSISEKPKFIIFIDSLECSTCLLSHLHNFSPLEDYSNNTGLFDLFILLSPKEDEKVAMIDYTLTLSLNCPIYFDIESHFTQNNSFIPPDSRFHFLLTDSNGKVIFVGNPIKEGKLLPAFEKVIHLYNL